MIILFPTVLDARECEDNKGSLGMAFPTIRVEKKCLVWNLSICLSVGLSRNCPSVCLEFSVCLFSEHDGTGSFSSFYEDVIRRLVDSI